MTPAPLNIPLTPELALALDGAIAAAIKEQFGKEDPRSKVLPDQEIKDLTITCTVEIGSLSIGHDTDKTPTASIPHLTVLALLVKRMGATRDAALTMIRETMEQALTLNKSAAKLLLQEIGVADAEREIKEKVIAKLPRTAVKKTVKVSNVRLTLTGAAQKQG